MGRFTDCLRCRDSPDLSYSLNTCVISFTTGGKKEFQAISVNIRTYQLEARFVQELSTAA